MASSWSTRCLLGAHGLLICLCLCSVAAAQPVGEGKSVEDLLLELSGDGAGGANAFRSFVQRAQLVVTGLMHISILLLPRLSPAPPAAPPAGKPARSKAAAAAAASSSSAAGGSNGPAPGFPADGSDPAAWERVRVALDRESSSGMDWSNCCVYGLSEGGGAAVAPEPPYPVAATAAYHAAQCKKEALVCNDYDAATGPHFADWRALHAAGARSMAAAPVYSSDKKLLGVLSLASTEPHAFDRSRVVWLLALAAAPLAAGLRYTAQALRMEALVHRVMPALLEQNYLRNTSAGRQKLASAARAAAATASSSAGGGAAAPRPAAQQLSRSNSPASSPAASPAAATAAPRPSSGGGLQFAEQAEVLITSGSARSGELPPAASTHKANGTDATKPPPSVTASKSNTPNGRAAAAAPPSAPSIAPAHAPAGKGLASAALMPVSAAGAAGGGDPYLSGYDSDLDWGDFFFNLVSMCIVYAYFSEAAVAGENQAAVVVSMCIAAVDIVLLGLRWLWYEQYITYGGAVLQVFQAYRLVVLPVANTWMSWSLLHKLGVRPGGTLVATLGAGVGGLLVAGARVRSLLHAPLQLASVLFAAASTTDLCTRAFGSVAGVRCMGAVSLLQLSLGVALPAVLVHVLDSRAGAKPYLPHVQAKRWLVQQP